MTVRRNRRRPGISVDELVDQLPDQFLVPELEVENGNMTGLGRYMRELDEHLRQQLGMLPTTDPRSADQHPPIAKVMKSIGCSPSEWYRVRMAGRAVKPAVST